MDADTGDTAAEGGARDRDGPGTSPAPGTGGGSGPGLVKGSGAGPGADAGGGLRLASATGRWVVFTTVLGSSMALLDSTVVNVALPHIGEDLGADLADLQWTVNAYMLTLAGLILLGGALGDRYGRRRIFVVGVVWFALGSLLCGIAPNAGVLIAARALQGIGGALLTPGSLAIIQASFHPDDRSRAVGLWSGFGGVGAAIGPFVGGWLVDGPGWRWVFLINVPLAVLCVPVALRYVPESRDPAAHSGRFDVLGAVLGAGALALVTYALIAAEWWPGVIGVLVALAFVAVERRSPDPMLPLSIFRSRIFTVVNVVTLCVYAAFGGFFFLAALQLQVVSGYSALQAGLALLPTTLLMLLFSAASGQLAERTGPRLPLTVGPLLCAGGLLLMLRVGPSPSYWTDVLPALLVLGLGMVTLVAPLTATVLSSVPTARAGIASGVNNAAARAAGLVAVAALPLLVGMGPEAYRSAAQFDAAFDRAMPICAGVLVVGSLVAAVWIRRPQAPCAHPECRVNCGVGAPPLEAGKSGGR
ncbi:MULTISPECIES: MFS transporter [Streptomyces]|uniref:MFS transporter n=1 Tax=Streptomyces tsukubensis (strain DSM 42081 / NBRC 108919 / NRRL 18488 / 9993) TaxID=1114943 RepID=I2N2T9_STRT9|nr:MULTISPECIES: MFS transporter [Streptomyces]AZK95456.1 MFS transporter [Streptomyces tsukubensis]EIF91336.1 transmembrane efflux protein [Streptomyces tsukubensis NRRL18488]MYS66638.1 DHA2 family efflux MFS transporter permease subunit [Streptomyces sp. SID5473]QKM68501.1 MFS transporter [Streptomyces tsukubensis NRRL18488]TAI43312.1 DHA2 family efflux MFS transporter permease subunit [Streptomyces tsukubensis]